ncbi:hypothetical protein [Niallia circulans]|uniref:hypothetical protein n=1 Tax=Niallia circulans TaxID=1397 RepID=UPI00155FED2A|nr:hypothetical protein [Niallia circulans]NRG33920.1 hypothetical protein [Niallia circulans]
MNTWINVFGAKVFTSQRNLRQAKMLKRLFVLLNANSIITNLKASRSSLLNK